MTGLWVSQSRYLPLKKTQTLTIQHNFGRRFESAHLHHCPNHAVWLGFVYTGRRTMLTQTTIQLNLAHPEVQRDLADCHGMHRRTMRLFRHVNNPRDVNEVLYRIDRYEAQWYLVVQSTAHADVTTLPPGYAVPPIRQRDDVADQIGRLAVGAQCEFETVVHMTKKSIHTARRVTLHEPAEQRAWLERRATNAGMTYDEATLAILPEPPIRGRHPNGLLTYNAVRVTGVLTVVDPAMLLHAITTGIGAGKAYGCGLLTLTPHTQED